MSARFVSLLSGNLTAFPVTAPNGGAIRTGTTAGNTLLLQAYNTTTSAYVTLLTLTAGTTPTLFIPTITAPSANAVITAFTGGSLTGSNASSFVTITGTWNTTGVVDGALRVVVTDTASGTGSLLFAVYGGVAGATPRLTLSLGGLLTVTGGDLGTASGQLFTPASSSGGVKFSNGAAVNSSSVYGLYLNAVMVGPATQGVTWNDANTAASGTVANRYLFGIAGPTLTATNASVTYTIASCVYIGAVPVASTNVTIGTAYSLYVIGNARFDADVRAATYHVGTTAGADGGPFTAITGITVSKGIVTAITGT